MNFTPKKKVIEDWLDFMLGVFCGNLRTGRNKQTCVMCFFYRLHASKTIEQLFFTSTRPYKKGDRFQLNGKTYVIL